MKRSPRALLAALAALPLAVVLGMAACSSITGLDELSFTAGTCTTAADCPKSENECAVAACVDGFCGTTLLDDVDAPTQVTGDCKVNRCHGGKVVVVNDDVDIRVTPTDCDEETCVNGQPVSSARAEREGCNTSGGNFCNGQGTCVECLEASDCPTSSNPCMQPVCEGSGRCVVHPMPQNVPIAAQKLGDCWITVCDGAGETMETPADDDIEDDANECTKDSCEKGMPLHVAVAEDSACGQGLVCNASGQCSGCTSDAQCNMPQTCGGGGTAGVCACKPKTCASEGRTCGPLWDGCSKYIYCDNGLQDGDEKGIDCGAQDCNLCGTGVKCSKDTECLTGSCVDGVCCNEKCTGTCRACSAAVKGGGADGICGPIWFGRDPADECTKTDASGCGTTGVCNGAGACAKYDNGTICQPSSCSSPTNGSSQYTEASRCFNGSCQAPKTITCDGNCGEQGCLGCTTNGDCPSSSFCDANACKPKLSPGATCTSDEACESAFCADGVCCDNACSDMCKSCNLGGLIGTCSFVAVNMQDPDTCGPNKVCSSNHECQLANGQPTTNATECLSGNVADGVCCDTPCDEPCRACNIPGKAGTCGDLGAGQSDPTGCAAPNVCNGVGGCRKSLGMACTTHAQCESGKCIDGYCCNESCGETCHACNVAGALGYCVLVPFDMSDPNTCTGNKRCDSLGQCKDIAGQSCSSNAECLNDNCVDGYCCSSLCSGPCVQCSSSGQCENLSKYQSDPGFCTGAMVCDGTGTCKKNNGETCSMATECASGFCVDGVCCNSECTGACKACNLSTSLGQCGNLPANTPDTCVAPSKCNGLGACYKFNGESCTKSSDCLSGSCSDGVCCDKACNSVCDTCTMSGNVGKCQNWPAYTEVGQCSGTQACDGMAVCKTKPGETCSAPVDCLSNFCVDGVCCDQACTDLCMACNVSGNGGKCFNVLQNQPDDTCQSPNVCNGAGACGKNLGQACSAANECFSNFCVDGVCCNSACGETCKACNVSGQEGTCFNVPQNDPDFGTCWLFQACDGAGVCKAAENSMCSTNDDCASGQCGADGKCFIPLP